jgi:hypothetical protein
MLAVHFKQTASHPCLTFVHESVIRKQSTDYNFRHHFQSELVGCSTTFSGSFCTQDVRREREGNRTDMISSKVEYNLVGNLATPGMKTHLAAVYQTREHRPNTVRALSLHPLQLPHPPTYISFPTSAAIIALIMHATTFFFAFGFFTIQ